ncbi:MAG TPA: CRTAC1 family protein [Pirellulaceae bacterium]|nr:CRTAC1 family protein [Pirellulaceae bacterium]
MTDSAVKAHGDVSPSPAAPSGLTPSSSGGTETVLSEIDKAVAQKLAERETLDKTLWASEVQAQKHEEYFVALWDQLRETEDRYSILKKLQIPQLGLPVPGPAKLMDLEVEHFQCEAPTNQLTPAEWAAELDRWQQAGYKLTQSEWHHRQFSKFEDGSAESRVDMTLHIENPKLEERIIVSGLIRVRWQKSSDDQPAFVESVDARGLQMWRRKGPPAFVLAATLQAPSADPNTSVADFLGTYDTDGDGDAEIFFGNQLYRNGGGGRFAGELLIPNRAEGLNSAVLADFNGDGKVDLLCADPGKTPELYIADNDGRFSIPPQPLPIPPVVISQAITAGDINGDGHLDVWITQYKGPYDSGQMPSPYYDANDGYPSYLLMGDGTGQFTDKTKESGLSVKRFRRTYSASFVDLDDDGDLDLIVVSDFAGVDLYTNDGSGKFTDVSEDWLDDRNNFGMSHAFDDFDGDGRLDFYVTGMASTTARRLEQLGLHRPEFEQHNKMRPMMGYGNRMYLAAEKGFRQPEFREQVARTGWSWGTTTLDFDNDGDRDIFVGNGHISGKSASDYCSIFWRHDIYAGSSKPDPVLDKMFLLVQQDFEKNKGGSWNGFEHNCLLVRDEEGYVNLAFLMGIASEFDTRAVVSNDIDSDGRQDLLVVEASRGRPAVLHVFRNNLVTNSHWIGVRLIDEAGHSPLGTKITLQTDSGRQTTQIVAGNSFTSQHAATAHFGLGDRDSVRSIEVRWVDGTTYTLENPQVDSYHLVKASSGKKASH